MEKISIQNINSMTEADFIKYFGNIIEHGEEYVKHIYTQRPFSTVENFTNEFISFLDKTSVEDKLVILNKHPELGTKKLLTKLSELEQKTAGISELSVEEMKSMDDMNIRYFKKYGFPFVLCVRDKNPAEILKSIRQRMENDVLDEISNGFEEVKKIVKVRLFSLVSE